MVQQSRKGFIRVNTEGYSQKHKGKTTSKPQKQEDQIRACQETSLKRLYSSETTDNGQMGTNSA